MFIVTYRDKNNDIKYIYINDTMIDIRDYSDIKVELDREEHDGLIFIDEEDPRPPCKYREKVKE